MRGNIYITIIVTLILVAYILSAVALHLWLPSLELYILIASTGLLLALNITLIFILKGTNAKDITSDQKNENKLSEITELEFAKGEIERLTYYDELTGLPNRRMLLKQLSKGMQDALADSEHVALLFIDIDHFKTLNDNFGHEVGDMLLKEAALRITSCFSINHLLARPGGDEFGIVLPGLKGGNESTSSFVLELAEKIREALFIPFDFGNHPYHSGASIGIAVFPRGDQKATLSDMLRQADTALFRSKDNGRNSVSIFETHMQEVANERMAIEQDLRKALSRQELRLFLQPQNDEHGRTVGAECLLRWQHPEKGLIPPSSFIPVAESTGLIVPIGNWLLYQACAIIKRLDAENQQVRISVNVSTRQFRQPDFVAQVQQAISATGANPNQLVLEITESLVMDNVDEVVPRMVELKCMGIGFSIDDFGTGYSSLSYLKVLPLRELKIDKSFVDGLPYDADDAAIVGSILALAKNLRLEVVAEGIEKQEQSDYLKSNGCQLFQGYLHGKPVFCEELIASLLARPNAGLGFA